MLKIKDSVNLKELEKYGFKVEQYCISKDLYKGNEHINIYQDDKQIDISLDGWETNNLDTLYDLIQDGLVEKVK